jgi:diketogulonate reductase-like aldo/keto reductase
MNARMPHVTLPSGVRVRSLGLGTWHMGEDARRRSEEADALRLGIDLGMNLIDTAEMYGEGGAEEVVGLAIAGRRRDEVFLVSKVYPHHATRRGVVAACERSLRRMRVDRIDLYLLHWKSDVPMAETVEGFGRLVADGKVGAWGVSNFDVEDMEELFATQNGADCATNQVLYNLRRRGIESALLPWCLDRGVPLMAYSPVDQGRLAKSTVLIRMAKARGVTASQLALAWLLSHDGVIVIPKASGEGHLRDNYGALSVQLTPEELQDLDAAFPAPQRRRPLEMF